MAAHSGSKIVTEGLDFFMDPSSKLGPQGLTYFLFTHGGGHPATEEALDSLFAGATFRSTGLHEGEVNWANARSPVTMPNYGPTIAYTSGYPSYIDITVNYCWLAKGWIYAPETGLYEFSINGDDAMDWHIDEERVAYWYGGHGFRSDANRNDGSKYLTKGWHELECRFEENGGGDGIALGWKPPSGEWEIVPAKNLKPMVSNLVKPFGTLADHPKFYGKIQKTDLRNLVKGVQNKKTKRVNLDQDVNKAIYTPYTRGDLANTFTLCAWFKYDGSTSASYRAIFGGDDPTGGTEFFIGKNSGNTNIGVQDGNYRNNVVVGSNAFDGNWHQIVYSYNSGTGKTYLDGVLKTTSSFTKCNSAEKITIGTEVEGSIFTWEGEISSVQIYKKVLSDNEVKINYNGLRAKFKD